MQAVSGNRFSVKSWTLVPPQLCLGSLSFLQWPLLVFLWPHHSHHVPWASPPPRPGWGPVLLVACCQSLMAFPYHRLIVLLTKEKESYKSVIHMASTLQSLTPLQKSTWKLSIFPLRPGLTEPIVFWPHGQHKSHGPFQKQLSLKVGETEKSVPLRGTVYLQGPPDWGAAKSSDLCSDQKQPFLCICPRFWSHLWAKDPVSVHKSASLLLALVVRWVVGLVSKVFLIVKVCLISFLISTSKVTDIMVIF